MKGEKREDLRLYLSVCSRGEPVVFGQRKAVTQTSSALLFNFMFCFFFLMFLGLRRHDTFMFDS